MTHAETVPPPAIVEVSKGIHAYIQLDGSWFLNNAGCITGERDDLPGGGRRLDQGATGYVATICNGTVIRRGDRPTGARPGRVVRGSQPAPAEALLA